MNIVFVILGMFFLGLGVLGVYLPLLPATPFLLLAAACFGRGSERFHHWFTGTKLYSKNIAPIQKKEPMTLKRKAKILGTITLFIGISFFMMKNRIGRGVVLVILVLHYLYFFFGVKTAKGESIHDES